MPTCGQRSRRGVEPNPPKWYLSALTQLIRCHQRWNIHDRNIIERGKEVKDSERRHSHAHLRTFTERCGAAVADQLPPQLFGHLWDRFTVIGVAGRELKRQQFPPEMVSLAGLPVRQPSGCRLRDTPGMATACA